ncbi:bone morphogenetic protein 7-like [Corticium candelabrum]|uniref:bone morphogenetic protein 7-like n=1 Tax=Corticium candelabrum TaxID=121492 RepID=UPI002E2719E9|nr:bone morphogenetic protein 7-like [Corticium candelabrum]
MLQTRKETLLELLGLPIVSFSDKLTIPQYMWDLYNLLSQSNETKPATESGAEEDVGKAAQVDMVQSLTSRQELDVSPRLKQVLIFHTPPIASADDVTSAELRLFREVPQTGSKQDIRVVAHASIYNVTWIPGIPAPLRDLVDKVDLYNTGGKHWVVFDVTHTVRNWVKRSETNCTLELHTEFVNKTKINPTVVGLKRFSNDSLKEALVVVFSNNKEISVGLESRIKRGAKDISNLLGGNELDWGKYELKRKDSLCHWRNFYVDFRLLRWNIIAPQGYRAGYCAGVCPSTLTNNMNASNHARIQSLMHHLHPDKYPPVACVPVQLAPIMVLYRNSEGNIALRRMRDMIAVSCGCQ